MIVVARSRIPSLANNSRTISGSVHQFVDSKPLFRLFYKLAQWIDSLKLTQTGRKIVGIFSLKQKNII